MHPNFKNEITFNHNTGLVALTLTKEVLTQTCQSVGVHSDKDTDAKVSRKTR